MSLKLKTDRQLQKDRTAIYNEIRRRENKANDELNASLVGKCFRYWNGYNSDQRWWMYVKVLKTECGGLRLFSFQEDTGNKISIEPSEFHSSLSGSYQEISVSDFVKAWDALTAKISKFDRYVALP